MAAEPFAVRMTVRSYELDGLGHVNQAVYHSYAEHARSELFRAAGCAMDELIREYDVAPVLLETRARFSRELRAGTEIIVDCAVEFGAGKVFSMNSVIRTADGTVSATVDCVLGIMDMTKRKLVADPAAALRAATADPALLGIPAGGG